MCLAQGHNAVTPVRLKPVAPRSLVRHFTTEPLRSLNMSATCMSMLGMVGRGPPVENLENLECIRSIFSTKLTVKLALNFNNFVLIQ